MNGRGEARTGRTGSREEGDGRGGDGFERFLKREAGQYHEPPPPPTDSMWKAIAERVEALSYHAPPPAPRDAIWAKIDAAVTEESRETKPRGRRSERWPNRKRHWNRTAVWLPVAAAFAAAVLVGREALIDEGGPPRQESLAELAFDGAEPDGAAMEDMVIKPEAAEEAEEVEARREAAAAGPVRSQTVVVTEELRRRDRVGQRAPALNQLVVTGRVAATERHLLRTNTLDYAAESHFESAAVLLGSFRRNADPAVDGELAVWADEMLGETRLLLDVDAGQSLEAVALLKELEFVLAQLARLRFSASEAQRVAVRESLSERGTLWRLIQAAEAGTI